MAGNVLPPVKVTFTASVAAALKSITSLADALARLDEVASASAASFDAAVGAMEAGAERLAAVGDSAKAAATSMDGLAASTDAAATGTDSGLTAITDAAARMAEALDASVKAATEGMTALGAEAKAAAASVTKSFEEVAAGSKAAAAESGAASEGMGAKLLGLGEIGKTIKAALPLSLAAVGYESVKMASQFQRSTTQLVTSAGESTKALGMVRSGMLDMAGQVGVKAQELSQALYYVEAAGYHAGDGLTVLRAAAQGAAAEGADTTTVAKALTDVLVDYHLKASAAADVTSKMITAVAHGKTNLQDFSASFASIVPAASAAGISFNDVGAALSNMTNHGFTAQRASQNLAQALRSLLNPTGPMKKAFDQFGVSTQELSAKLHGPNGLTDAMEYLSQAASKAGKEGTPEFAAALKSLMGTAPGANAALATVGANFQATTDTITAMAKATSDSKGQVQGFALVQQTLGQQWRDLTAAWDSTLIRLGNGLTPVLTRMLSQTNGFAQSMQKALGGIASGFSGRAGQTPAAPHLTGLQARMQEGAGAGSSPQQQLTGWQQVGQMLRGVADNFRKFGDDVAKSFHNIVQAAGPTLQLLGGALLEALRVVASILGNVLGPALVKVTAFLDHNKGVVRDLIAVALAPLAVRLAALSVIKPIGAIAGLAKDVVMFPVGQVKSIFTGIKSGIEGVKDAASRAQDLLVTGAGKAGTAWRAIKSGASTAASAIADFGSKAASGVASLASSAWSGIVSGLQAVGGAAKSAALGLVDLGQKAMASALAAARSAAAWIAEKVALVASAVAEKAAAAAEWLLNIALDANPIMLVVLAIAALVAALIYAYTHSKTFRDIVQAAFKAVGDVAMWLWHNVIEPAFKGIVSVISACVDWVKSHWPLLLGILTGPIGMAVYLLTHYWKQISQAFSDAWSAVKSAALAAVHWVSGLPGMILNALGDLGSLLWNAGASIMTGLWNGIKSMGSWVASQIGSLVSSIVPGPVKKILGIFSPSRVMHEIGVNVTRGLANGITAGAPGVVTASTNMANAVINHGTPSALAVGPSAAALAAAGGAGQPIIVNVDGKTLFQIMQTQALRNGRRNPTTGLVYNGT